MHFIGAFVEAIKPGSQWVIHLDPNCDPSEQLRVPFRICGGEGQDRSEHSGAESRTHLSAKQRHLINFKSTDTKYLKFISYTQSESYHWLFDFE